MEDIKQYTGSGRQKTERRLMLESLDLIEMLKTVEIKDLANDLNVSLTMIYYVLNEQLDKRKIGFKFEDDDEFGSLMLAKSRGAWMNYSGRLVILKLKLNN